MPVILQIGSHGAPRRPSLSPFPDLCGHTALPPGHQAAARGGGRFGPKDA